MSNPVGFFSFSFCWLKIIELRALGIDHMEWRGLLSLSGFWDIEGNIYIDENLFNLSPPSMNNFGPAMHCTI